ncbi:MAG: hypothetical protein ACLRZ9_01345 [Eubacterium sp.]
MKGFISTLFIATFMLGCINTNASAIILNVQSHIEKPDNEYYLKQVITDYPYNHPLISTFPTNKTITKTKTTYYKNSNGTVLWSVSIKATFTYNGSTSKCTSYSHSTIAPAKTWSIKNCLSQKSGNSATAKVTVVHTGTNGSTDTVTKWVTIKCSPDGTVS